MAPMRGSEGAMPRSTAMLRVSQLVAFYLRDKTLISLHPRGTIGEGIDDTIGSVLGSVHDIATVVLSQIPEQDTKVSGASSTAPSPSVARSHTVPGPVSASSTSILNSSSDSGTLGSGASSTADSAGTTGLATTTDIATSIASAQPSSVRSTGTSIDAAASTPLDARHATPMELSHGAKIGLAVGVTAGVLALLFLVCFFLLHGARRRRLRAQPQAYSPTPLSLRLIPDGPASAKFTEFTSPQTPRPPSPSREDLYATIAILQNAVASMTQERAGVRKGSDVLPSYSSVYTE